METMAASPPSHADISHLRSSQFANPAHTPQATRQAQAADVQQPAQHSQPDQASQGSIASYQSTVGGVSTPRLETSSSNVSQLTSYSDLTPPGVPAASEVVFEQQPRQYVPQHARLMRTQTPDGREVNGPPRLEDSVITSPTNIISPVSTNGTKRTASGHVKNAPSLPNTPLESAFSVGRPRGDSTSSTSSRAGELAMNLKARLGYAMAKVQNGWEHRNIHEVEVLAAKQAHAHPHRHSMSHVDSTRRTVGANMSNGHARASMYGNINGVPYAYTNGHGAVDNTSYPSKRHSGAFASSSQPVLGTTPRLQPAADIRPTSNHAPTHYPSNNHISLSQPIPYTSSAMSPPRTPVNGINGSTHAYPRRPAPLLTDSQTAEAEREALQALFQLGSPHTSQADRWYQHSSQASSSQASPLRSDFGITPRRVTFARSESSSSAAVESEGRSDGGGENVGVPVA